MQKQVCPRRICKFMALPAYWRGLFSLVKRLPSSVTMMPQFIAPGKYTRFSTKVEGVALLKFITGWGSESISAPTARPIMWPSPVVPQEGFHQEEYS